MCSRSAGVSREAASGARRASEEAPVVLILQSIAGLVFLMAALPTFIPLALVTVARIRDEEAVLADSFEGYAECRAEVRYRLVPGVR